MNKSTKDEKKRFYQFYCSYFKKEKHHVFLLLLMIFIGIGLTNITPYLYGKMIDDTTTGKIKELVFLIILYFAITMISTLFGMAESYYGEWFTYRVTNKVKNELFEKIIHMRCKGLDKYQIGELMARLNSDAEMIVDYYIDVATSILSITFNLVVALIIVFRISVMLSIVSIFFLPLSICVNLVFRKYYRKISEKQKKFGDRYSSFIVGTFSNILGIRAFGRENTTEHSYKELVVEQWGLMKQERWLSYKQGILTTMIACSSTLILIYISAVLIIEGSFTIGSMVSFMSYIGRLNGAVSQTLTLNLKAQGVIVSMDRLIKLQSEPDEKSLPISSEEPVKLEGKQIEVENLTFRYREEERPVFQNFNMYIQGAGLYSIVGLNGSGKSSLLKLLVKFYDPENGTILIDTYKLEELNIRDLRKCISYIPKEPYLLDDSILENLKIGNVNTDYNQLVKACSYTGLGEFINSLPDKYNTKIGENGKLLSSGQKQKLCLARAMLNNPQVYLFDEITSDLDGKAEKEIIEILKRLAKEKVVLLVTHRVSSVMGSKKIFLIEQGRVGSSGTHEQLLQSSSLYNEMFTRQSIEEV